jgi:hypothetical protein
MHMPRHIPGVARPAPRSIPAPGGEDRQSGVFPFRLLRDSLVSSVYHCARWKCKRSQSQLHTAH